MQTRPEGTSSQRRRRGAPMGPFSPPSLSIAPILSIIRRSPRERGPRMRARSASRLSEGPRRAAAASAPVGGPTALRRAEYGGNRRGGTTATPSIRNTLAASEPRGRDELTCHTMTATLMTATLMTATQMTQTPDDSRTQMTATPKWAPTLILLAIGRAPILLPAPLNSPPPEEVHARLGSWAADVAQPTARSFTTTAHTFAHQPCRRRNERGGGHVG